MFFLGWPLFSVLANTGRATRWMERGMTAPQVLGEMLLWAGLGIAMSAVLWFPWRRWMADAPLSGWRLLGLVALCGVAGIGFEAVRLAIEWPAFDPHLPKGRAPAAWARAFIPGVAMFSWVAVHYLLDTSERLGEERERALKAEALATEARLAMLRNELNPHFLFNAMNSIIGVIGEDPSRAQKMVRQLSGLLRHSLTGPESSTLGAEIEVALKYLGIEKVRFEERLQVEVRVDEALQQVPLPSMLLQPLVENSVKHGMGEGVLTVTLEAEGVGEDLVLWVRNQGRLGDGDGGVGLRNLRERLQLLPSAGRLEIAQVGPDVVATVTLPGVLR
jgi:two-component system, LytTR family, sensor kinase